MKWRRRKLNGGISRNGIIESVIPKRSGMEIAESF